MLGRLPLVTAWGTETGGNKQFSGTFRRVGIVVYD